MNELVYVVNELVELYVRELRQIAQEFSGCGGNPERQRLFWLARKSWLETRLLEVQVELENLDTPFAPCK